MPLAALDPSRIALLNWNIAKGKHAGWEYDLAKLCRRADLATLQEAKLEYHLPAQFGKACCWSFAPGFTLPDHITGVMTLSAADTVNHSLHSHREPWTRIPKAALVSEYRLAGCDFTLMVANVHAINFTAGVASFKRQLTGVLDELLHHNGPMIVAGDFNTWRRKRLTIVDDVIQTLGLDVVQFGGEQRKQAFGLALDHVFVRGLKGSEAWVHQVSSSDHNPMLVTLELVPELARQCPARLMEAVAQNL